MKVVFCIPFLDRPTNPLLYSLKACLPLIEANGWEHQLTQYRGCPYISNARADMTRRALDAGADAIVYLDYDISFPPESMLKLLNTEGDVVGATYRFKDPEIQYMVNVQLDLSGQAQVRKDGALKAEKLPAGFLKVSKEAITIFAKAYPHLLYGDPMKPHLDLFNHGAIEGVWYGEDYAFCKRWIESGNDLWLIPDIDVNHHSNTEVYEGNFHKYLIKYNEEIANGIC